MFFKGKTFSDTITRNLKFTRTVSRLFFLTLLYKRFSIQARIIIMKRVIIASNPFGYGPTGQAVALIHELLKRKSEFEIHFIGTGLCLEIVQKEFKKEGIKVIDLNERDEGLLRQYLLSVNNESESIICVGVQNRFIPKIAKELGIPSIFIDGLGWFWNHVPESHLLADRIYWTNFPNLHEGDKKIPDGVTVVGLLQDSCVWKPNIANPYYIVSLGGCTNPLKEGLQENYLSLALKVFSSINLETKIPIRMILGNPARLFLEKNELIPPGVSIHSYTHKEMMESLSMCSHHFSIGGQSSTMESLVSGIPTTFFLPSNMSQVFFQKVFDKYCSGNYYSNWDSYIHDIGELEETDELTSINLIDQFSKRILNDDKILNQIVKHCISSMNTSDKDKLIKLVRGLGLDGARHIALDILNLT